MVCSGTALKYKEEGHIGSSSSITSPVPRAAGHDPQLWNVIHSPCSTGKGHGHGLGGQHILQPKQHQTCLELKQTQHAKN